MKLILPLKNRDIVEEKSEVEIKTDESIVQDSIEVTSEKNEKFYEKKYSKYYF